MEKWVYYHHLPFVSSDNHVVAQATFLTSNNLDGRDTHVEEVIENRAFEPIEKCGDAIGCSKVLLVDFLVEVGNDVRMADCGRGWELVVSINELDHCCAGSPFKQGEESVDFAWMWDETPEWRESFATNTVRVRRVEKKWREERGLFLC